jgi:DNA polymerase
MPLDERRAAMLREIGVPFWPAVVAPPVAVSAPAPPALLPDPRPTAPTARSPAPPAPRPAAPPAAPPPSAQTIDISHLDWPALRQAVAGCGACGLCESRTQTVFGVGHEQAHWLIIGEAPGEQEDLKGEPFVGAAGKLLDNLLRACGLTRHAAAAEGQPALPPARQVYIANTLKCRPPRNRNPEREEMARCEPFLQRQIELLQPKVIVAMGRFAVQALLRSDEAIGRLRGRVHRYQGRPLIVTYHPAYLLRNLPDKARAWEDWCLALATMDATVVAQRAGAGERAGGR